MEYEKYCAGDVQQWELDSMNFYFSGHPLNKVLPQLPYPTDRIENIVEGITFRNESDEQTGYNERVIIEGRKYSKNPSIFSVTPPIGCISPF